MAAGDAGHTNSGAATMQIHRRRLRYKRNGCHSGLCGVGSEAVEAAALATTIMLKEFGILYERPPKVLVVKLLMQGLNTPPKSLLGR